MAMAGEVIGLPHLSFQDIRYDYGEDRWVTIGQLDGALLHKSWCERTSPFPGHTYPTGSVTGMPRAV